MRLLMLLSFLFATVLMAQSTPIRSVTLPAPVKTGKLSLEQLLSQRRSVREFTDATIELSDLAQLLWAAQGITHPQEYRTAPSAGALYPLELYVAAGRVQGLDAGIYHYDPRAHQLEQTSHEDRRKLLARAALSQHWVSDAAAIVVFAAVYKRTMRKYGKRGIRYVDMEVGHAAQNLFLQAQAMDLATVVVGAFDDTELVSVLEIPPDTQPLLLMPIGKR